MSDLSNIAGTLRYGSFDGTKRKKILIAYTAFTAFLILGMIGVLVAIILEQANTTQQMPTIDFAFALIGSSFGFLIVPIIFLVLIIKNEKVRKKILIWLQDAVTLGAYCEMLQANYNDAPLNQALSLPLRAKIRVKFKYNGKHYTKYSGYKNKNGYFINDYQDIWVKYADKSINILYSPKYDEVIVLKNN